MSSTFTRYNEQSDFKELPFDETVESKKIRKMQYRINRMEHDLFFLYVFLTSEGICDEACEYLENHSDDSIPFHKLCDYE